MEVLITNYVNSLKLTAEQEKMTYTLHSEVHTQLPSQYKENDQVLKSLYTNYEQCVRFLVAREFKYPEALQMWEKWVQWHQTYRPDLISPNEEIIKKQLKTNKLLWLGHDKQLKPALYYRMKYHIPNLATPEETVRFILMIMEKGIKISDQLGSGKVCVIYDRRDVPKENQDPNSMKTSKGLIPLLQDYYPERLATFYVLGANWFFRGAYMVVSMFMSKKTTDKVNMLSDVTDLQAHFDKENMIVDYGGSLLPSDSKVKFENIILDDATQPVQSVKGEQEVEDKEQQEKILKDLEKEMQQ